MNCSIRNRDSKTKIGKIRKLLNLANSKANIHEANLSALLAKNLMKKHGLEIADILAEDYFYEHRLTPASKPFAHAPETKHETRETPPIRSGMASNQRRDRRLAKAPFNYPAVFARGLSGGLLFYIIIKLLGSI